MIKKLRLKFILTAMFAVTIVLTVIVASLNFASYYSGTGLADKLLDYIVKQSGNDTGGNIEDSIKYETKFFAVKITDDGSEISISSDKLSGLDIEAAILYAKEVVNNKDKRGYIDDYRYLIIDTNDAKEVYFIDCYRQISISNQFFRASLVISAIGLAAVFVIVVILSKRVIAPIAENYEKQKRFITDASHELKTPLTIISANNELLTMETGGNESTESIAKQIARMTTMTKNLTMLARIDEGDILENKEIFSITNAVNELAEEFARLAESRGKILTIDIVEAQDFQGNETMLRQMLATLLDNAVKYSESKIHIHVGNHRSKILITIYNDAKNLPVGDLKIFFDRFYRSDEVRAAGIEGSGIGLSMAQEIVEQHHGKISAYSVTGNDFNIKILL